MSTKMKKGILRPFRYFTNIMDSKEQDMQIGFPTDVKHVAHIGWDGPAATNTNKEAGAPSWMKDYHSAPLDSSSFRSDRGGSAAAASNPWASQEIVLDGAGLGDTSFKDTKNEAGNVDVTANDSPPSPGTRRSRRNRSRGATSSIDVTGSETTEKEKEKEKDKKEKGKKGIRKNRKKDKEKAAEDTAGSTCQDLPAVPKKSNRRKNKGSSEGSGGASSKDTETTPEEGVAPLPPVVEREKDHHEL